jgi:hypothetical protein
VNPQLQTYLAAMLLQWLHLVNFSLQEGQLNVTVPLSFAIFSLHELHVFSILIATKEFIYKGFCKKGIFSSN